ncbi:MAG: hypothetical protein JXB04_13415 [Kiritimatiellae bacterium]|nr:hypothetical protein [Kiritimatiellia bacterium]
MNLIRKLLRRWGSAALLLPAAVILSGCRTPGKGPEPMPTGFVTIQKIDGRYWFMHDGKPFIERGVNVVGSIYDTRQKGGRHYNALALYDGVTAAWAGDTLKRLRDWHFNTVAAWSDEYLYTNSSLYHTRVIPFGPWGQGRDNRLMDVFSEKYAQEIDDVAARHVAPHAQNPYLIGYFANNELPFYGRRGWPTDPNVSLLTRYMNLPEGSPSKIRAVEFLRGHYSNDFAAFTSDWETDVSSFDELLRLRRLRPRSPRARQPVARWAGIVAEEYYRLTSEAIRRHDPNHLFLGSRFAYRAQESVMAACGKYADVISVNLYRKTGTFDTNVAGAIAALTGKPIMITEFSWSAMENSSGCANTTGADVAVPTQRDRAECFRRYTTAALEQPYIVGYDWFCYADQSPDGRFDGENCNYGLVDIHDQPYTVLLDAIRDINGRAETLHSAGAPRAPIYDPTILADYREVQVRGIETPLSAPVLWADGENDIYVYGDDARGGGIDIGAAGATRTLTVRTGQGWGCGFTANAKTSIHPDGSADVSGATRIVVRFRSSQPFRFNAGLNESGHGIPWGQTYDGHGHADGEAYSHMIIQGQEGLHEYEFPLADMEINPNYGNQRGNMTIDTDALASIGFYFPGGQGDFELELESIVLK